MALTRVKFAAEEANSFSKTVRSRVDAYFKDNNRSKHANANMVIKSITIIGLYLTGYTLMLLNLAPTEYATYAYFGCWLLMGLSGAAIGLSIMHDANHGAYSTNKNVNKMMGMMLNFIGGYAENWKAQHNVLHHTFTNVEGLDEDIDPAPLLRFSPHKKLMAIHKLQFIYAWMLYGLMTLSWITSKDFLRYRGYYKNGLMNGKTLGGEMWKIAINKVFYYTMVLAVPILVLGDAIPWYYYPLGILLKHYTAGVVLGAIFQPAHVTGSTEFPLPKEGNQMENTWMVHQMLTTADFSPRSRVYSWFIGGLNYQVEHHLFPNICHVHYKKIAPIVEQTAKEFGLPYNVERTFIGAIYEHTKMLYHLGRPAKGDPELTMQQQQKKAA